MLVENKPGVLSRVSGLFSGRGYSLESITYGETMDPSLVRITLTSTGEDAVIEQIMKQLNRLIDTIKVLDLTHKKAVHREVALVKVSAEKGLRSEILKLAEAFKATVLDVAWDSVILEINGNHDKIDDFLDIMSEYTVLEVARSGLVSMERGKKNEKN